MPAVTIEERLTEVEKKLDSLLRESPQEVTPTPWWDKWFGAFKDNPDFDSAMKRGAAFRREQPTALDEQGNETDVST
jgi:hypothetical protein